MRFRLALSALLVLTISTSTWADVVITGERVTKTQKHLPLTPAQTQALAMLLQNISVPPEQIRQLLDNTAGSASEKFTLYIKGDRMRMDSGRYSMTVHVVGDTGRYVFLDNAKKEGVSVELSRGLIEKYRVQGKTTIASGADSPTIPLAGLPDASWASMSATGKTRQMLGDVAHQYLFEHSGNDWSDPMAWFASMAPQLAGLASLGHFTVRREAWVVPTSPGVKEFQKFYRGEAGTLKGPLSFPIANGMTALTELGLPYQLTEETSIWFGAADSSFEASFVTESTTTLTSVSATTIDDEKFFKSVPPGYTGGAAQSLDPATGCDCSCAAFKEFQALGQRSKKDPEAKAEMTAKAACGAQCMGKWVGCALQH